MSEFAPDSSGLERGPQGDRGERGPQGNIGDRGDRGPQGSAGDIGPAGEAPLVPIAEAMVTKLVKADRRRKWQVRALGLVAVVSMVAAGLSGKGYFDNKNDASSLRSQSITNCENNDAFRLAQVDIWQKNYALQAQEGKATSALLTQLIATLAQHNPAEISQIDSILGQSGKASAAEVAQFLAVVKADDAPKNCQALYAN